MHACEVHAYETHAREMHAYEVPVHEMHAREVHAHQMHAHKVQARETHAREMHACETPAHEMHTREMYTHEIYAHRSMAFLGGYVWRCGCCKGVPPSRGVYTRQARCRRLASSNTINAPNPHHGQNAAVLLSCTYVFAAFDSRWPGIAFLILALSGKLGTPSLWPSAGRVKANKALWLGNCGTRLILTNRS